MIRKIWQISFVLLIGVTSACSSGGGSGSGGTGGGGAGTLVIAQSNVTLTAVVDQVAPNAEIRGTVSGVNESVFVYISVTSNGIQSATFIQDTETSGIVSISTQNPASLGEGVFNDTVTVSVCLDSDCNRHVGGSPKTINVQYRVTDDIRLEGDSARISYSALEQPSIFTSTTTLKGVKGQWVATSDQSWLSAEVSSGVGAQDVTAVTDAGQLPPGTYDGTITFTDSVTARTATYFVTLIVAAPHLSFQDQESVTLLADGVGSTVYRTTLFDAVSAPLTINADAPNWLKVQITEMDSTTHEITLGVDHNQLPAPGVHNEAVQFYVEVGGEKVGPSLLVNLIVASPVLTLSDRGVALTHNAVASKLSETVTVAIGTTPTSDWSTTVEYVGATQNWLTITPKIGSPHEMVISAEPSGLTNGEVVEAIVHVQSDAGALSETLRVGFYVDTSFSTPAATPTLTNPNAAVRMRADPVRPLVYVSNNSDIIDAYHVYSGALMKSFTVPGGLIKHITVANDGSILYAMDENHIQIARIDLTTDSTLMPLQAMGWQTCDHCGNPYARLMFEYARVHGRDVLITNIPHVLDANTGELLNPFEIEDATVAPRDGHVVTSANGHRFLMMSQYETDNGELRSVTYNAETQKIHTSTLNHWQANTSRARQFSLNSDGSRIYNMCSYPTGLSIFSTIDMALIAPVSRDFNGEAYLINDNEVLCVSYYQDIENSYPHAWRVKVDSRELLSEYSVQGAIEYNQQAVSGDGERLITRSNSYQTLTFQAL
jgi:hypothetical protein